MATATGIEIAGDTLRCVVLEGSVKAPRIKAAFQEIIEPAPEDENPDKHLASRVGEILKEKNVPTGNVVFAIDGRQIYSREVMLPFTRAEQIQKTIKFEAEKFLPAAPVEMMIVDYYKVAEMDGKSRLLVCGVQKTAISEILALCRGADFEPHALDLDSACLANVGYAANLFAPAGTETTEPGEKLTTHTTSMILDVSKNIVRLALVEDDRLRRTRTFAISTDSDNLKAQALDKIVREVKRTQASCSLAAPFSVLYLTGPASSANVETRLRKALQVNVEPLKLEEVISTGEDEEQGDCVAAGSCALGAALKALGADSVGLDFRKEEFVYQKLFDMLKAGLAATAVIVFFLAFMLAYTFNLRMSIDRQTLDTIRSNARETFITLLPGEPRPRAQDTKSIFNSFKDAFERKKSGRWSKKTPKITSAIDIFRDFGEAVKRANVKFKLKECRIDQNTVVIKGVVKNRADNNLVNTEIANDSQYLELVNSTGKINAEGETEVSNHYKVIKPE